jgi:Dolichyl-phosphate-mannose-protein mannosyltransferase
VSTTLAPTRARPAAKPLTAARARLDRLVLASLYVVAVVYHSAQSLGHRTPAVFTDELLFAKLAQSLAGGDGFVLRGEGFFFPAPVAVLIQAVAWLLPDAEAAYEVAKVLNAAVMSAAVFPAYWLARQLTNKRSALLVAGAAVAAPGLLYHSYLMTDAAGYPVFLLAIAVMTRALGRPTRRWELAVVGVSLFAVLTRTQFVVLPLAYLAAVAVVGRSTGVRAAYREHRLSTTTLAGLGLLAALTGGVALGAYVDAVDIDYPVGETLRWAALSSGILPFTVGWLVAPGAVLGVGLMLARPRSRAEAAFAALAALTLPLLVLEAALIATGDAERVMERYLVYLVPLAFVAFLAYVERGAPRRFLHAALALALGTVALVYPLATEAEHGFSFDSPTLSAFGELAVRSTDGDAAAIFAGGALLGSLAVAGLAVASRVGVGVAAAGACVLAVIGVTAYAADRGMTSRTYSAFAASPPDWRDESGVGKSDYLALPGAQTHAGWNLESWNRDFGRPVVLRDAEADNYSFTRAHVDAQGRLVLAGGQRPTPTLVVNDHGSAAELDWTVALRPRSGLTVWRLHGEPRLRSLADGLYHDGWASAVVRYRVWGRSGGGVYRLRLALPSGRAPRTVQLHVPGGESRTVVLEGGDQLAVELSAGPGTRPAPLEIRTDRSDFEGQGTPAPRLVAVRVSGLGYTAL